MGAIGNTKLDHFIKRGRLLSEAQAWLSVFDSATKTEILDWIRQDQLFKHGIDGNGEIIGYYSPLTESISNGRKKANTHYTFLDTGDFFRSGAVYVFQTEIAILFDGQKDDENLYEKYGKKLTYLTDEHFELLKEKVRIGFINYIRKVLHGG